MKTTADSVLLGYEVGSGSPVSIPVLHTVITGQTQRAGKTTALEALISRSARKAVAFVTKRGEGSFVVARTIPPYFREQADWKFVASILEASRGEKLKFERSWIIRASKGARTLADVQRNVRRALDDPKTRGMNADVYLTLDAYLEDVVPLIAKVEWAKRVTLAPGLNVVDMTSLNVEMQHLVIRSTIEWVLEHEEDTIVVVPEAWKFIPQGRGTPVKLAAESFIRQAAGLRNYLWLDSQDMAGVEKLILKSVPVWVLGVQREANEIKRTLAQIPAGIKKPKAEQIATLGLGEFFVCHDTAITKVYVQPTWMSRVDAIAVARGHERAEQLAAEQRSTAAKITHRMAIDFPIQPEHPEALVDEREAQRLRTENAELKSLVDDLRLQIEVLGREVSHAPSSNHTTAGRSGGQDVPATVHAGWTPAGAADTDALYESFKARLLKEPAVLRVLASKPQIDVEVERTVITMDGSSQKGRMARLVHQRFFRESKSQGEVRKELARTGGEVNPGRISEFMNELVFLGFLTREADGYREVPEMIVNVVER